jgi:hypothetical protein
MLATRTYGVLTGRVKAGRLDPAGNSAHYQIWIDAGVNYRIAVNVRSVDKSEVLVHYDPTYVLPTKRDLPALAAGPPGFTPLPTGAGGAGLDYLRDDLFPLPPLRSPSVTAFTIRAAMRRSAFRRRTASTIST